MAFSPGLKDKLAQRITALEKLFGELKWTNTFSQKDEGTLTYCFATISFFLGESMPFDEITMKRIDAEVAIINKTLASYIH